MEFANIGDGMQHLFVYGTLRPGHANEHVMNKIGGQWRAATIRGNWFKEGWGYVNHGLRGMVVDDAGEEIPGFVFSSENLANNWALIDDFEGSDYERVDVRAGFPNGDGLDVFVYALKR